MSSLSPTQGRAGKWCSPDAYLERPASELRADCNVYKDDSPSKTCPMFSRICDTVCGKAFEKLLSGGVQPVRVVLRARRAGPWFVVETSSPAVRNRARHLPTMPLEH
jgi:hypothetical protein